MVETFSEIFPINHAVLPPLFGYEIQIDETVGEYQAVGGQFSYALQKEFGGIWAYSDRLIITDIEKSDQDVDQVRRQIITQPEYQSLRTIHHIPDFQPPPQAIGDWVVRLLNFKSKSKIETVLNTPDENNPELGAVDIGNATVEREIELRSWVVWGEPAISISVKSHPIYKQDLKAFIANAQITAPEDLAGLRVRGKASTTSGVILGKSGTLGERRSDMLAYQPRTTKYIVDGSDDEWVLWIDAGKKYEYVISQLRVVVENRHYKKLGINGSEARKAMTLSPEKRAKLVYPVFHMVNENKVDHIPNNLLKQPYASNRHVDYFANAADVDFVDEVQIGSGVRIKHDKNIASQLAEQSKSFYHLVNQSVTRKIGVFSVIPRDQLPRGNFWERIQKRLASFGVSVDALRLQVSQSTQIAYERTLDELVADGADFILAILPESELSEYSSDQDWDAYINFKQFTVKNGIPNQVINKKTLTSSYAVDNIALAIAAKLGNLPFMLASPLDYTDVIVGIDIGRQKKAKLSGTRNAVAMLQVYQNDGRFLEYSLDTSDIEGETVHPRILHSLFSSETFSDKRVLIHRDGNFRGKEKETLQHIANELGSEFYFVEVLKNKQPRLYARAGKKIELPAKGICFAINSNEAFLVSSPPPFGNATPRPLRIVTNPPLQLNDAIHSVLSLTLLHHGSILAPRLPVTIHHSDKIAELALKGIKPAHSRGTDQYWL